MSLTIPKLSEAQLNSIERAVKVRITASALIMIGFFIAIVGFICFLAAYSTAITNKMSKRVCLTGALMMAGGIMIVGIGIPIAYGAISIINKVLKQLGIIEEKRRDNLEHYFFTLSYKQWIAVKATLAATPS